MSELQPRIIKSLNDLNSDERGAINVGPPFEYFFGLASKDRGIEHVYIHPNYLTNELQEIYDSICGRFIKYNVQLYDEAGDNPHKKRVAWNVALSRFKLEPDNNGLLNLFHSEFGYEFPVTFRKLEDLTYIFEGQHWAPFDWEYYGDHKILK